MIFILVVAVAHARGDGHVNRRVGITEAISEYNTDSRAARLNPLYGRPGSFPSEFNELGFFPFDMGEIKPFVFFGWPIVERMLARYINGKGRFPRQIIEDVFVVFSLESNALLDQSTDHFQVDLRIPIVRDGEVKIGTLGVRGVEMDPVIDPTEDDLEGMCTRPDMTTVPNEELRAAGLVFNGKHPAITGIGPLPIHLGRRHPPGLGPEGRPITNSRDFQIFLQGNRWESDFALLMRSIGRR